MRFILFIFCFSIGLSFVPAQSKDTIRSVWMNRNYALVHSFYPNVFTPADYKYITRIDGTGLFHATKKGLYGILDTTGKEKTKMEYNSYSVQIDQLTQKIYVYLKKHNDQVLVDELGNIIGKGFPTIKEICGGYVIVRPDARDTAEKRLYYTDKDKYMKQGLMDLKGNWIEKPSQKQYSGIYGHLLFIYDYNKEPYTGKLYDLKLNPLNNPTYDDVRHGSSLENDSLKTLKRIIAYNRDFIWLLDSNGKELKKEPHLKLPIKIKWHSDDKKSFRYDGKPISDAQYDGAFFMDNYLLGFDSTTQKTDVYDRHGDLLFTKDFRKIFVPWDRRDNPEYKFVFAQDKTGIYMLNDKLEKITPPLQYVNTDDLYKDNLTQLFICKRNNKFGVIDHTGKIIVPFIYKNEPSRYTGRVIKIYGASTTDFYSVTGEQLAKGADDVEPSKIDANIYYVTKGELKGVFKGNPYKPLIPFGTYSSFEEIDTYKTIIAKNKEGDYLLDKNLRVINKEAAQHIYTTSDSLTFCLKLHNNKEQLINYRNPETKTAFDQLQTFSDNDENYLGVAKMNLFLVTLNGKHGLANIKSELILNTEWDTIISIARCAVLKKGRSYFITNQKFELDRNMILDSVAFNDELNYYRSKDWRLPNIQVKKDGKWGVFDLAQHKWIIYPKFDNVVNILGKTNNVQHYYSTRIDKWTYLVEPEKNIIYGAGFNDITPMADHAFMPFTEHTKNLIVNNGDATRDSLGKLKGGKYGIIDPKGKLLHKCDADHVKPIVYSMWPQNDVYGYFWNIGGTIKQFVSKAGDSTDVESYDANGNSTFKKMLVGRQTGEHLVEGKCGIVNADGKEVIPIIYDDMVFRFNGGEGVGDVRSSYSDTLPDYDHMIFPVYIKKDGKWGAAELSGKILLPVIYDTIYDSFIGYDERAMRVSLNGKIGYFDFEGKEIFPVSFTGEQRYGNYSNQPDLIMFQKNGTSSTYTLATISGTLKTIYLEDGSQDHVNDTITITQKSYSGGTYGFWDMKKDEWALEPIYEDIRLLQVFTTLSERQIPKRASVMGKYSDQCDHFIKVYEPFEIKKNGKWGLYFHGKGIVLQPEYDEIKIQDEEVIVIKAGVEKRFTFEGQAK